MGDVHACRYAAECEARRKRMDYVLDSVRKKGSRLERRSKQRKQRFEEQEALRESVDARSAEIMDETTGRIGGVLAERTRELATRLERRTETLVETLLHAWDEFDAAWTHGVLVSCWDAMREPVRWKRAVGAWPARCPPHLGPSAARVHRSSCSPLQARGSIRT